MYRDLGAHIDGFSAVVAHTVVIGASKVHSVAVYISFFSDSTPVLSVIHRYLFGVWFVLCVFVFVCQY